jgi:phosphoglycolate phosphatase-like HAD superfamily hydrolase
VRILLSDLDGTIADTGPLIFASLRVTCEELGFDLTPEAEMSWALGPPLHWCLEQLGIPKELMDDAVAIFERAHTDRMDSLRPIAGADVVIRELSGMGVAIGVATIKPQLIAEHVLDVLGLRAHIACVHGRSDDYDPRTKTDLLRESWAELGNADAIYVGDHSNDEVAARELDIPFLRYPAHSWDEVRAAVLGATADVP